MGNSLKLFAVRGIDIRLHITFPLILVWAAWMFYSMSGNIMGGVFGVIAISLLFVLVTLHELGHSFAALHYDVPVKQIVLSPIGGVAQLARMPEKPWQELVIAIAGPAVNIVMALIMALFLLSPNIDLGNLNTVMTGAAGVTFVSLFTYVFVYNIFLAVFNLIPAFPMDGGRVLRALLAMRLEYARATKIAANVGRVFAVLLAIWGLYNVSFFQILIAVFIFGAATQESKFTEVRHTLKGYTVGHVFSPNGYRLEPSFTLQQAAKMMVYSGQSDYPVVYGERFVGLLSQSKLQQALRTRPAQEYVTAVMERNIQPVTPNTDLLDVQSRMAEEQRFTLPVVSEPDEFGNGRYLGLVSAENIRRLYNLINNAPTAVPKTHSM